MFVTVLTTTSPTMPINESYGESSLQKMDSFHLSNSVLSEDNLDISMYQLHKECSMQQKEVLSPVTNTNIQELILTTHNLKNFNCKNGNFFKCYYLIIIIIVN